ncbi:MAG: hypothetical protein QNJ63_11555 [Calothrix sp. MO_192.B10]|nr:hypothetical protein [Calothrix sp. MO_192.B10]
MITQILATVNFFIVNIQSSSSDSGLFRQVRNRNFCQSTNDTMSG